MKTKKKKFDRKKIIRIIVIVLVILVILAIAFFGFYYPNKVFRDNESLFAKAGERYYQVNRSYLPSEEGRVLSVNLGDLIRDDYLDDIYIPYSKKVCDLNNSTVKVIREDGDYQYYTYLKCGRFESNTDHEGPVITLNGDDTIRLDRGEEYNEPGVKSVVDDSDGKMNVDDVRISGEVNTNTVGTYEVTYSATDRLNNRNTVTRKIIVEESLSNVVRETTSDTNGYYKGESLNNYVMFNNMVFRIVKINSNDTVTIASDEVLANVDYNNVGRFADSSIDSWLNDYFYNLLEDKYKDLVVSSKWCDDVLNKEDYIATECNRTSAKRNVGILSIQDYNNTLQDDVSFLDFSGIVWYANLDSDNNPWTMTNLYDYPLKSEPMNKEYLFNIRPALTLKKSTKVLSGDGSEDDPYILVENNSGRRNTNINERQVGEYISYSGYIWRIAGFTDDDTTEIIMTSVITNDGEEVQIGYNNTGNKVYNPNREGNIGYQVINEMTRYVSTGLFTKTKVEVPIYNNNVTYEGKHDTKTYNNIVTIPSVFDIFTAKGDNSSDGGYWYIDSSKEDGIKTVMYPAGTVTYTSVSDDRTAGVKIKAYLKDDVYITDGDGSLNNPYTIND